MTKILVVKEKAIIFSEEMVRAILKGEKSQTRRILKLPKWSTNNWDNFLVVDGVPKISHKLNGSMLEVSCPYGAVGDYLWVRETWAKALIGTQPFLYKADGVESGLSWNSPVLMPRIASRILLKIVETRAEKLQDISKEDAISEGIVSIPSDFVPIVDRPDCARVGHTYYRDYLSYADGIEAWYQSPVDSFRTLWQSIHKKWHPSDAWENNPYVWVIKFEVVRNDK